MDNAAFFTGDRSALIFGHHAMRWGLVTLLAGLESLFGYSEAAYYGIPLFATALLALAVFLLSRRLMGSWWSGTAAVITVVNPIVLSRSSHPFPDLLGTGLITMAIACIAWLGTGGRRRDVVLALSTGLLLGWAYGARETVVMLAPVIVVAMVLLRIGLRNVLPTAVGLLMMAGAELTLLNNWFDDPFARLRVLVERNTESGELRKPAQAAKVAKFQGTFLLSVSAMFRRWGEWGMAWAPVAGFAGLFGSFLTAKSRFRSRLWAVLAFWLVSGWIAFVLIGLWRNERGGFVFNLTQIRYWYLLVPPVAIGVVGGLESISRKVISIDRIRSGISLRVPAAVCTVLICLWMIVISVGGRMQIAAGADHMLEFRNWISSQKEGGVVIAAEHGTRRVANLFLNDTFGEELWPGHVVRLNNVTSPAVILISVEGVRAESVAVVNGNEYDMSALPVHWDLLHVSKDGMLSIIAAGDRDGLPNDEIAVSGPAFPVPLVKGESARWTSTGNDVGPFRYRVSYTGPEPRARCMSEQPTGNLRTRPALYMPGGADSPEGQIVDMYCPSGDGRVWLALVTPEIKETTIHDVVLIASNEQR